MDNLRKHCPEPCLVPREHPYQQQINRLAYMRDDRDAFAAFIADKPDFFGALFASTLADMDERIDEEEAYYVFLREGRASI